MKFTHHNVHALAIAATLLSACASSPPATVNHPAPPLAPSPSQPSTSSHVPTPASAANVVDASANERALAAAIGSYDRGDFGGAIKLLNPLASEGLLDPAQLLRALKTLAFSQCSTGAVTACRQTFERAFRADATFDLAAAERGHPIWGPQFERARRTVLGR